MVRDDRRMLALVAGLLLIAVPFTGTVVWPLSVGIDRHDPATVAVAMLSVLTLLYLAESLPRGLARAALQSAVMLLPAIFAVPHDHPVHEGLWPVVCVSGLAALLALGRVEAWCAAVAAGLLAWCGVEQVGLHGEAIVIALLAAVAIWRGLPTRVAT